MRAASTVDGGDAQRRALTSLFTRFTADRDALASAIRRVEERLDALGQSETPHLNGHAPTPAPSAADDERFRQLEQSVVEATREARHAIEVARQSLDGMSAANGSHAAVEVLRNAVEALERRVSTPPAPIEKPDTSGQERAIASLELRVRELGAKLDALASLEHRMTRMENEADGRLQDAVARISATMAELDDSIARALEQSSRALDRTAEALSAPSTPGDAPNLAWMREELDARIEATVVAVKDTRAQLSARLADVTQRDEDVLGRLGQVAMRQDALERSCVAIEARMADVGETMRQLGERLSQVAAIAAQDRQQLVLGRLQDRLDVLEAGLRRLEPEESWSVTRALEPVVPSFLAGWLWTERR